MRTPRFHVSAWKAGTAPLSGEPIGQFFQSFPVHFPVAKGEAMKTGIQISSLKPLLTSASQVHQAFEKISAMGCRYVQLQWIDSSVPMEDIAQALQDTGLVSVSVQEIHDTFLQNPDYYLRLNQLTGGTWLCISRVPARLRSRQGLAEFVETFRRLEDTLHAPGQKLCFHPVASDLTPVDGLIPADYLLEKMPEIKEKEVLAIFEQPMDELDMDAPTRSLCLALDGVQDPGNMGTIIRVADWFGIEHLYCSQNTVDVYNPKTIQATMGALARVKVHYTDLASFVQSLPNIPVYGTFLNGDIIYQRELSPTGLIIMGNEGNGISPEIEQRITNRLYIPNYPIGRKTSESLNVAIATSIICAEFRRRFR